MKNNLFLFLFLVPAFLFAQYPTTGNKARLGYQTTGDGLIWRGVAADTAIKPRTTANAYFQLDTVNRVLRRYIATQGSWQVVGGGTNVDSLIYATRYWVNSNFFPLEGGTLTGTGGAGFIGLPSQGTAPGTPASGLNVYAQGSSFNWKGTDGYERQFASTLTGGRTYTLPNASGTFALGTGTTTRLPIWTSANVLGDSPITYNSTTKRTTWDSPGVIELPMGTDAQRPSPATTSDFWYNTTSNGPEWYNGTRWAKGLESTANTFTSGSLIFADANGQAAQVNSRLYWNNTLFRLGVNTNSPQYDFDVNGNTRTQGIHRIERAVISAVDIVNATNGYRYRFGIDKSAFSQDVFALINLTASVTPFQMYPSGNTVFSPSTLAGGSGQNFDIQSAGLRLYATNKGFLTSQLTETQKNAISSAADGLMIYQKNNTKGIYVRDSVAGSWKKLRWGSDSIWLKPELEAGRDVTINGTSSSDFRIQNTRVQFDNKFKVGSDSSFVHNPVTDTTLIKGNTRIRDGDLRIENTTTSPYLIIEAKGGGNKEANIYLKSSGAFSPIIEIDAAPGSVGSAKALGFYNYGTANGGDNTFRIGSELGQFGARSIGRFAVYDSLELNRKFAFNSNGLAFFDIYATPATTATALSKTQSNYVAGFAVGGTVVSTLSTTLGLYAGSGTLSQHTTRALIPSTGNLLFSQKYNSNADSAFIHVVNNLDGNREVRIGLTDTASTGFATLTLKQDADNEVMAWDLRSSDSEGQTRLTGDGGNISATVDDGFEFQVSGMVRAKREAYAEITSTSSPQTLSDTYSDNLINQGGTQATFTLNMPASPEDGQVCYITFNNAISTLTIDGNGETIVGSAVTTGVPGSQRKFKFYSGIGWIKQY